MVQYSETTMKYELKPLKVGGILDQSILILKDNFGLYLKLMFCVQIPVGIAAHLFFMGRMPNPSANPSPEELAQLLQAQMAFLLGVMPVFALIAIFIVPIMSAAGIHISARLYTGQPATIGRAFRAAFSRAVPLIWTWILIYFFTMCGFMLCVLPGILMTFWFALASTVAVLEGISGFAALSRSWYLMRTFWIEHYVAFFLLSLVVLSINAGIGAGSGFVLEPYSAGIVATLLQAVTTSFQMIATVVFYFSCRCRVENFDLVQLAKAVAAAPGPAQEPPRTLAPIPPFEPSRPPELNSPLEPNEPNRPPEPNPPTENGGQA
jgi:hypothetical protein